jgi:hypothetical protein
LFPACSLIASPEKVGFRPKFYGTDGKPTRWIKADTVFTNCFQLGEQKFRTSGKTDREHNDILIVRNQTEKRIGFTRKGGGVYNLLRQGDENAALRSVMAELALRRSRVP